MERITWRSRHHQLHVHLQVGLTHTSRSSVQQQDVGAMEGDVEVQPWHSWQLAQHHHGLTDEGASARTAGFVTVNTQ